MTVSQQQIPSQYDLALGTDPSGTVYGYVLEKGSPWIQTPDLKNLDTLVAVASPNQIDRYLTIWPEESQGNWSKGERQVTFINAKRYFTSDGGVDVSKPNALQLLPAASTTTYTLTGTYNQMPMVTDGNQYFVGVSTTGKNFVGPVGGVPTQFNIADGTEIYDWMLFPGGVHFGTSSGIWGFAMGNPPATTHTESTDPIGPFPCKSMAYYGGLIYFITSDGGTPANLYSRIKTVAPGSGIANPVTQVLTTANGATVASDPEQAWSCICASGTGIFLSATNATLQNLTCLYTFDGSATLTKIGEIPGYIMGAAQVNGIVYFLAHLYETGGPNLVLHSVSGNQVDVLDDTRWALSDFQIAGSWAAIANPRASLWGDGRWLYIAWPGGPGLRLDLQQGGVARIGGNLTYNQSSISAHTLMTTSTYGVVDASAYGTTGKLSIYNAAKNTGTLTTSYFDWGVGAVKYFRSLSLDMASLPASSSVAVSFRVDNATAWTAATMQTLSTNRLVAYLPAQTKGQRVQFLLTLTAGSGNSPVVRAITAKANLGRVWKGRFQCHRNQQLNNGQADNQGAKPQDLLGNIENIVANAGRAIAYVPSLTNSAGSESVNVIIESYQIASVKPGLRTNEQGAPAYEGTVELVIREDLG